MTISPAMSESLKGIEPGMKGKANAKFPSGTMTVDAMNKTFADPNLVGTYNGRQVSQSSV